MPRDITLEVTHPDRRVVRVDVQVLPLAGVRRNLRPAAVHDDTVHAIDADELVDEAALVAFLIRITRSAAGGAVVRAACLQPYADRLLEVLGITGVPPSVIRIKAPAA
jgi:hypothetical protein